MIARAARRLHAARELVCSRPVRLLVYSRGAVEAASPPDEPHVVISVTTHEDDRARLPASATRLALLRLAFVDADAMVIKLRENLARVNAVMPDTHVERVPFIPRTALGKAPLIRSVSKQDAESGVSEPGQSRDS